MASKRKRYGTTRSGRTLDDELIEELAAEAERGYNVDETSAAAEAGRRSGQVRPPSSPSASIQNSGAH